MQRADGLAGSQSPVSLDGCSAGLVGQHVDYGVQRRVHRLDPRQMGVNHLRRAQFSARNALRQFGGRELPDLAHRLLQQKCANDVAQRPAHRPE